MPLNFKFLPKLVYPVGFSGIFIKSIDQIQKWIFGCLKSLVTKVNIEISSYWCMYGWCWWHIFSSSSKPLLLLVILHKFLFLWTKLFEFGFSFRFLSFCMDRHLLDNLNFLDESRVGIWGWGYGGYVASMVLGTQQQIYKCGISVSPITDWLFYSKYILI